MVVVVVTVVIIVVIVSIIVLPTTAFAAVISWLCVVHVCGGDASACVGVRVRKECVRGEACAHEHV